MEQGMLSTSIAPLRNRCIAGAPQWVVWLAIMWMAGAVWAADPRPVVGPGATKEEVLDEYGWPTGQSQAGAKEILIYPQGRVLLDQGRVERVDFSLKTPWPAPRPRPGTAGDGESWYTNWPEALREAERRRVRVLVLFVGSDWSPPSKQFLTDVAESADFLTAFLGNFVLVRLDYPTRTTQLKALRSQNLELRERYAVTTYPALIIAEPDGTLAARVDLNRPLAGDSYRAQVIAAVREAREALAPLPPLPGTGSGPAGPAPNGDRKTANPDAVAVPPPATVLGASNAAAGGSAPASLASAGRALSWGLGGGSVLAALLLWLFWRKKTLVVANTSTAAERVADAASGLPSVVEMAEWNHARVRAIIGVVAESDGYKVAGRAGGAEGDLGLTRAGEEGRTSVIVTCAPASAGPVSAKRLRELFGTITIEGVGTGWYVGLAGFSPEAREYAQTRRLVLISGDGLREQLRVLTDRDLARALSRGK